jgi:hypothetical protein
MHPELQETIDLHRISGEEIRRLREATLSKHRAIAFHTLHGQNDDPVSMCLENTTYITMPASWLNRHA